MKSNSDQYLIFDAHLDLAMNAMEWNRDLTWSVNQIRESETGQTDKPDRGRGTVALPAMRSGNIGLCVATQIARFVKPYSILPGWHSPEQAWAQTQGQLAWYKAMEAQGQMTQIVDLDSLDKHLSRWQNEEDYQAIGYMLSLEGADSILSMEYLEKSYEQGLRALGPAHYGPGIYAMGTDAQGGLTAKGPELLQKMEELGIILDVTHLCDESFWEALDIFKGAVWASHSNCRSLVPDHRQFSDVQIKVLLERNAVIGVALDAWMMVPAWIKGQTSPQEKGLTLEVLVDHIDHICQIAGNSKHTAIGSDLDGAFGTEQCPMDLDTIADLQKIPALLRQRGYNEEDIQNILSRNWLRFLRENWI
ncbi:MAG: membrane dipeptidase [Microscillaceae bacterium]|nr:membrane dipeptidase [Microscillaceae bacterium]